MLSLDINFPGSINPKLDLFTAIQVLGFAETLNISMSYDFCLPGRARREGREGDVWLLKSSYFSNLIIILSFAKA